MAGFILPPQDVKLAAPHRSPDWSRRRRKAGLEAACWQPPSVPKMKVLMGPKGIISVLILALAAKLLASRGGQLLRHVTTPVGRLLGWPSPAETSLRVSKQTSQPASQPTS